MYVGREVLKSCPWWCLSGPAKRNASIFLAPSADTILRILRESSCYMPVMNCFVSTGRSMRLGGCEACDAAAKRPWSMEGKNN
jgi:hypothetical protein